MTLSSNKADLQVATAFLPGRICDTHVTLVAKNVLNTIGHIYGLSGVVPKPVAFLTEKLGESWF